jgi:hypothetical protein
MDITFGKKTLFGLKLLKNIRKGLAEKKEYHDVQHTTRSP